MKLSRRKFAFGLGFGLFTLGELTGLPFFDKLAAGATPYDLLPGEEPKTEPKAKPEVVPHVHEPSGEVRRRNGQPPSKWLRNLSRDEIRVWLKTIKVPPAYVEGMTYQYHLTAHHGFYPRAIQGLNHNELFKLHSAAHHGY